MKIIERFKYFIRKFDFLKVYHSPFKPFMPKFYIGKIAIGTPYFFPRRWVKFSNAEAIEEAIKSFNNFNHVAKSFDEWYKHYKNHSKAVKKTIGFDIVSLGWKTKWTSNDFRFEFNPVWSFVFYKWQIAILFQPPNHHHYWECWLYYNKRTKGTTKERIEQCRNKFPQTWTTHYSDDKKETTDYYNLILKNKWK